jgi:hypothetical protein
MANVKVFLTCLNCKEDKLKECFKNINSDKVLCVFCVACQQLDIAVDLDTASACKKCKTVKSYEKFLWLNPTNYKSKKLSTCVDCRIKDNRLRQCPHGRYKNLCKLCVYNPRAKAKRGEGEVRDRSKKKLVVEPVEPIVEPVVELVVEPKLIKRRKLKIK